MPSTRPKCYNCGELIPNDIIFENVSNDEPVTGGTRNTCGANITIRKCRRCGGAVYF
jgi:hypothetical protein